MKKLSVRHRGGRSYEVGPAGLVPTVTVTANSKREALREGKKEWKRKYAATVELPMRRKLLIARGLLTAPAGGRS